MNLYVKESEILELFLGIFLTAILTHVIWTMMMAPKSLSSQAHLPNIWMMMLRNHVSVRFEMFIFVRMLQRMRSTYNGRSKKSIK